MDAPTSDGKLPFKLIYHDGYDLNFGPHVFPSQKYRLIRDRLLGIGFATEDDLLEPPLTCCWCTNETGSTGSRTAP